MGTVPASAEGTTAAGQNNTISFTVLTLSKAVNIGTVTIGIPAAVTFYDRMGITEEEVEEMSSSVALALSPSDLRYFPSRWLFSLYTTNQPRIKRVTSKRELPGSRGRLKKLTPYSNTFIS